MAQGVPRQGGIEKHGRRVLKRREVGKGWVSGSVSTGICGPARHRVLALNAHCWCLLARRVPASTTHAYILLPSPAPPPLLHISLEFVPLLLSWCCFDKPNPSPYCCCCCCCCVGCALQLVREGRARFPMAALHAGMMGSMIAWSTEQHFLGRVAGLAESADAEHMPSSSVPLKCAQMLSAALRQRRTDRDVADL